MAYRYTFAGVIHPERAAVSVSTISFEINAPGAGIVGQLAMTIAVSQLTAVFTSQNQVSDFYTLKNHVADAVHVAVDAFGYVTGRGYDVELVQLIPAESVVPIVFGVGIPALEDNSADPAARFTDLIRLFQDPRGSYLQRCFADLREAIRSPRDTGFFCFRAIESLRQFFVLEVKAKSDKESWEMFRTVLAVDRSAIDYVKEFADPARHGAAKPISDTERAEVFRRTWAIVGHFVEFAKAGYASRQAGSSPR